MAARGKAVGIDMTGDVTRVPNTRLAHALLDWAHEQRPEAQHELKELIFQAYYTKNIYLGDIDNLASLAKQSGYDADAAKAYLLSGQGEANVVKKSESAKAAGVNGIPYFTINNEISFSGAQDPDTLKQAIRKAIRR